MKFEFTGAAKITSGTSVKGLETLTFSNDGITEYAHTTIEIAASTVDLELPLAQILTSKVVVLVTDAPLVIKIDDAADGFVLNGKLLIEGELDKIEVTNESTETDATLTVMACA